MQGYKEKRVKISTLIGSRPFQAGVSDYRSGKPLDASEMARFFYAWGAFFC